MGSKISAWALGFVCFRVVLFQGSRDFQGIHEVSWSWRLTKMPPKKTNSSSPPLNECAGQTRKKPCESDDVLLESSECNGARKESHMFLFYQSLATMDSRNTRTATVPRPQIQPTTQFKLKTMPRAIFLTPKKKTLGKLSPPIESTGDRGTGVGVGTQMQSFYGAASAKSVLSNGHGVHEVGSFTTGGSRSSTMGTGAFTKREGGEDGFSWMSRWKLGSMVSPMGCILGL